MRNTDAITPKSIDEYIAMVPPEYKAALEELRFIIKSVVPEAEESISYQVPCFKYIYMLVGIGVNKNFSSLYTMSPALVKALKDELKGVKVSGATIHFPPGEKLPVALIKKIVKARIKENKEHSVSREKKPSKKK